MEVDGYLVQEYTHIERNCPKIVPRYLVTPTLPMSLIRRIHVFILRLPVDSTHTYVINLTLSKTILPLQLYCGYGRPSLVPEENLYEQ